MKRIAIYMTSFAMLTVAACSDGEHDVMQDGNLFVNPSYIGEVQVTDVNSRGGDDEPEPVYTYNEESLKNSTILWISKYTNNNYGVVRKYNGLSSFPTGGDRLTGGKYLAEAWAGDSVSASWTARYYKAIQEFTIDGNVNIDLALKLANVFASVEIDKSVDEVLTEYEVTVSHSRGSRTFVGRDIRIASFMMPSNRNAGEGDSPKEDVLTWKLKGTQFSGEEFEKEGTIDHVSAGCQYVLKFSHNVNIPNKGGALISLAVRELNKIVDEGYVVQPPTIQRASAVSIDSPILVKKGKHENNIYVEVGAVGEFETVELSGNLMTLLTDSDIPLDMIKGHEDRIKKLGEKGVWVTGDNESNAYYNPERNLSSMRITLSKDMINDLPKGEYSLDIYVKDNGNGDVSEQPTKRSARGTLQIVVSEDIVVVSITNPSEYLKPESRNLTPTSVVLPGVVVDETTEVNNVGLKYRVKGEYGDDVDNWGRVDGIVTSRASNGYKFVIESLKPNTTYEYRTVWTKAGETAESESASQYITTATNMIPNGDFEVWGTDAEDKCIVLYDSNTSLFWDSGNHGSITMDKNVTESDSNVKHTGNYSAKLQSQFVGVGGFIGKFAAGNAFVGQYLKTDGTDGILGWGRPFYFKPKALKGWVKYEPKAITHVGSGAPSEYKKGDMDKGIIYIALLTADKGEQSVQGDSNYKDWPVVIRTKASNRQLFDKNGSNVIAYGEYVLDKATEGDGMIEFTIPLEYYESMKNQKVYNLLITCSASKGGDYFTGGDGSVMYIDDFEFVY